MIVKRENVWYSISSLVPYKTYDVQTTEFALYKNVERLKSAIRKAGSLRHVQHQYSISSLVLIAKREFGWCLAPDDI